MIRAIAAITIAVFVFVGLPYAAFASSGCSEKHENISRFNPTELSDYQKCVFEWTGQEIGTVGDYIWMQHNGDFIHIHKDKLIGASNEEVREEIFKATLGQEIADELAQTKADLQAAERLAEQVPGLEQAIKDLKARVNAINEVKAAGSFTYDNIVNNTMGAINYGSEYRIGVVSYSVEADAPADQTHIANPFGEGYLVYHVVNPVFTFSYGSNLKNLSAATMTKIQGIVEKAYAQGYEDGYKAGYADGYRDGVRDTKAATQ